MPAIIQYILKLSVSAAVIYAFYYLVLRRLTFYHLNRWYLSGYTLLCFVIPFININPIADKADEKLPALNYIPIVQNIKNYVPPALSRATPYSYTVWDGIVALLAIGSVVLLAKLAVQTISFMRMKRRAKLISDKDSAIYHVDEEIMPFSFGKSIYLNKNMHTDKELGEIIMHEYVHVKQLHSADILIAELFCVVNWFNPFAWFIRHSIRQNLEFIADDNVVRSGINKKDYQYHLLKVVGIPQYRIANQFSFSSLKKRIIMMNRARSAKIHLLKFMFILPLLAVTLMAFRSEIVNTVNKITTRPKPVMMVNNSMMPTIVPNGTLSGWLKKEPVVHSAKKAIIRPDTASKESVELNAFFKGEVVKTQEIWGTDTYLVIVRHGEMYDAYSNLTSVEVKKGDKVKKGQPIGTADVDLATGLPKLKYQMYKGAVMVYDAEGSDTTKGGGNKVYVAYSSNQPSNWSTGSSGSSQVYTVSPASKYQVFGTVVSNSGTNAASPAPSYNASGTVAYDTIRYATSPAPYTAAGYSTSGSGNLSIGSPRSYVAAQVNSAIKVAGNRAMVSGYVIYPDSSDEITYTIDLKNVKEEQFAYIKKQFTDNGFDLIMKRPEKGKDRTLSVEILFPKDNPKSNATAYFGSDQLRNDNCLVKITANKKTKQISVRTYDDK